MTRDKAFELVKESAANHRPFWLKSTKRAQHPDNAGQDVFLEWSESAQGVRLVNDSGSWLPSEKWSDHLEFVEVK